jgi:hypothetical protein
MLISCLAYYLSLKMEATYSSETSFDFQRSKNTSIRQCFLLCLTSVALPEFRWVMWFEKWITRGKWDLLSSDIWRHLVLLTVTNCSAQPLLDYTSRNTVMLIVTTENLDERVALQTRILEMLGSNQGWDVGYVHCGSSWIYSVPVTGRGGR